MKLRCPSNHVPLIVTQDGADAVAWCAGCGSFALLSEGFNLPADGWHRIGVLGRTEADIEAEALAALRKALEIASPSMSQVDRETGCDLLDRLEGRAP